MAPGYPTPRRLESFAGLSLLPSPRCWLSSPRCCVPFQPSSSRVDSWPRNEHHGELARRRWHHRHHARDAGGQEDGSDAVRQELEGSAGPILLPRRLGGGVQSPRHAAGRCRVQLARQGGHIVAAQDPDSAAARLGRRGQADPSVQPGRRIAPQDADLPRGLPDGASGRAGANRRPGQLPSSRGHAGTGFDALRPAFWEPGGRPTQRPHRRRGSSRPTCLATSCPRG